MKRLALFLALTSALASRGEVTNSPAGGPAAVASPATGELDPGAAQSRAPYEPVGSGSARAASAAVGTNSASQSLSTTIIDPETKEFKPRDSFRFAIDQDPAQTAETDIVTVTDGGEAIFPVTHKSSNPYVKVSVAGKKLAAIRAEVKKKLDEEYYVDATIHLDFTQANRDSTLTVSRAEATIYGIMSARIPIPDTGQLTLTDAILKQAQNEFADLRHVKLHRANRTTKQDSIKEYNVKEMIKNGDRKNDPVLEDGDRIEVPERGINFFNN